jgi:hypothetical protein
MSLVVALFLVGVAYWDAAVPPFQEGDAFRDFLHDGTWLHDGTREHHAGRP